VYRRSSSKVNDIQRRRAIACENDDVVCKIDGVIHHARALTNNAFALPVDALALQAKRRDHRTSGRRLPTTPSLCR
jgi:hypothetical protein